MPDIALMGAEYHDVPAVDLPVVGGGTARFTYGSVAGIEQYIKRLTNTFMQASLPMPFELTLPVCTEVNTAFQQISSSNGNDIDITLNFNENAATITSLRNAFYAAYNVKKVVITGNLSGVTSYQYMMGYVSSFTKLDVEFDFTSVTTDSGSDICGPTSKSSLTYVRYKPNTLSVNQNLNMLPALDADSLVSIANGLNSNATGKTITLNATPKASLASIIGMVSDGAFTKDPGGSVSLQDFITNTKGWTIA